MKEVPHSKQLARWLGALDTPGSRRFAADIKYIKKIFLSFRFPNLDTGNYAVCCKNTLDIFKYEVPTHWLILQFFTKDDKFP